MKGGFAGVGKGADEVVKNLGKGGAGITQKMGELLPETGKINLDVECFVGTANRFFHCRLAGFGGVEAIFFFGAAAFPFSERNRGFAFHQARVLHQAHPRTEGKGGCQHQESQYSGTEKAHDPKISIVF